MSRSIFFFVSLSLGIFCLTEPLRAQRITAVWQGQHLGTVLERLVATRPAPLWLDRRVDPQQTVEVQFTDVPLTTALADLAEQHDLGVAQLDRVIYVGPKKTAAGLATLNLIDEAGFYEQLTARTEQLIDGLAAAASEAGVGMATECEGGMFGLVFTDAPSVRSFDQVAAADVERFKVFFHGMLDEGVYLAPSAFEAGFVSAAHGDTEIDATIAAAAKVFRTL
jgi:hypothetical protein